MNYLLNTIVRGPCRRIFPESSERNSLPDLSQESVGRLNRSVRLRQLHLRSNRWVHFWRNRYWLLNCSSTEVYNDGLSEVRLTHRPTFHCAIARWIMYSRVRRSRVKKESHLRARARTSVKTRGSRQVAVPATILRVLSAVYHFPHARLSSKQAARVHAAIYYSLLDFAPGFVLLLVNNGSLFDEMIHLG